MKISVATAYGAQPSNLKHPPSTPVTWLVWDPQDSTKRPIKVRCSLYYTALALASKRLHRSTQELSAALLK